MRERRRVRLRQLLEYIFARGAFGFLGHLPIAWGEAFGSALGRTAYRIGWRRRVVEAQLAESFPERDQEWVRRMARECYEHLGKEAVTTAALPRLGSDTVKANVEFREGREELAEAFAEGRGVVMVTGHFSNWELSGAVMTAHGYPVDAVMQKLKNPWLNRYITTSRERLGMRLVDRSGAWNSLLDYLREGRIVGFVADQDAGRSGVFVPFFGRLASTHRAPALLALRGGAPLIVGGVRRVGPRRYVSWAKRLEPGGAGGETPAERVESLTGRWVAELERQIRLSPEQYFWHHRRWKTRPAGTVARAVGTKSEKAW